MSKALEVLTAYWGYTAFRPLQEEIIDEVISGKDVLALMPTGGGKSITYQVPGLLMEGICIVVSPLIALIKDQVEDLRSRDIRAEYIVSGLDFRDIDRILDNCIYGDIQFLYVSPERLKSELFIERFKQMNVSLIAIDEAHCISQWGYDFRPSYLEIAQIKDYHPTVPVLALTASATPEVVIDIQDKLAFKKKNVLSTSFHRESLHYVVIKDENKKDRLLKGLQSRKGTGIVYVRSRKMTRELSHFLESFGIGAAAYHAGMTPELKDKIQRSWKKEEIRVIVATNAFGMGIDKANVRTVIHYDLPDSVEAYFQEAGRAGRDGLKAFAVIVCNKNDIESLRERVASGFPPLEIIKKVYDGIGNYYQLAYGSGLHESFVFDIVTLSERLSLSVIEIYNSIKILSRTGYYHLSDSLHQPSKIKLKVTQSELYYFEVANPKFESLIKTLLRSYTGLFDSYVRFNEYLIAKRMRMGVEELVKQLKYLDSIELIDYLASNDKPQLSFLRERVAIDRLHIDYESYGALKERQLKRSEAMIAYVESNICRSVQLLKYFGEKETIECGKCDICLRKKAEGSIDGNREKLISLLKEKELKLNDILLNFLKIEKESVLAILQKLSNEGMLSKNEEYWKWKG